MGTDNGAGDFANIVPAVAVFRCRLALRDGNKGAGKTVDLATVIIEVVFPGYLRAGSFQDAPKGIANRCPPCAAKVERAGRVGGDELQVDCLAGVEIRVAERSCGLDTALKASPRSRGFMPTFFATCNAIFVA